MLFVIHTKYESSIVSVSISESRVLIIKKLVKSNQKFEFDKVVYLDLFLKDNITKSENHKV